MILMTSTNNIVTVVMSNGEGIAQGWVFTLPAATVDNDLFTISGNTISCKNTVTYAAKTYRIRVQGTKSGQTTRTRDYDIIVGSSGAKGFLNSTNKIGFDGLIAQTSTAVDRSLKFNMYIPNATPFSSAAINGFAIYVMHDTSTYSTTQSLGTGSVAILPYNMFAMWSASNGALNISYYNTNSAIALNGATQSSYILATTPVAATFQYGAWNSVEISYTSSNTTTVVKINGFVLYTTTSVNNAFKCPAGTAPNNTLSIIATNLITTPATSTVVISDLLYVENGSTLVSASMASSAAGGTVTGTITFGNIN